MSDDKIKVIEVPIPPPTQLIRVLCSTCNHPFVSRSNDAFHAARADHDAYRSIAQALIEEIQKS